MANFPVNFATNIDQHMLQCNLKRRRRRRKFNSMSLRAVVNKQDHCQLDYQSGCNPTDSDSLVDDIFQSNISKQVNDLKSTDDDYRLKSMTFVKEATARNSSNVNIQSNKQVILAQLNRTSRSRIFKMFSTSRSGYSDDPKATLTKYGLLLFLLSLIHICCHPSIFIIHCQTLPSELLFQPVEARAEINRVNQQARNQPPANIDLNQLVNFFNSIQNQQRQRNNNNNNNNGIPNPSPNNNNVQPLPLGTMGGQRGGGGLATFAGPSSTPANPFAAAANFQPTRRQQVQFNSSPAPQLQYSNNPALTLNRINSLANNLQRTPSQQFNNVNNINNNGQMPQSINSNSLAGQVQQPRLPLGQMNRAQMGSRTPLVPPPVNRLTQVANQVRPITGFAPSGPPPNLAANNAISVVQSPPNAIGTVAAPQQQASTITIALVNNNNNNYNNNSNNDQANLFSTTTSTNPSSSSAIVPTSAPQASTQGEQSSSNEILISTSETPQTSSASEHPPSITTQKIDTEIATTQQQAAAGSIWNPVQQDPTWSGVNKTQQQQASSTSSTLAPSPDIVTVPPDYDPNRQQAAIYDIPVSAQMGGSIPATKPLMQQPNSNDGGSASSISVASIAPTAITTIIWSPPPSSPPAESIAASSSRSVPTRQTQQQIQPTRVVEPQPVVSSTSEPSMTTQSSPPNTVSLSTVLSSTPPSRIRDNSLSNVDSNNYDAKTSESNSSTSGVVYGKSDSSGSKPAGPTPLSPEPDNRPSGRPFIQSAPLDNQVRPFTSSSSRHHSLPFKPSKPLSPNGGGSNVVGSAFTIAANGNQTMPERDIQDYVAGQPPPIVSASSNGSMNPEPTISAHGRPDPFVLPVADSTSNNHVETQVSSSSGTTAPPVPKIRRPTFKPKPAVPPIRIDSCIVGDDSSCEQANNERCVTEYGISSCHCRPGFARLSQLRGYCSPVVTLQFSMKIDKLSDDRKLIFNHSLENPNSEEYQYLEFETLQAISSGMQHTALSKQFMGARVNKFLERKSKIWANVSVNLELNNVTKNEQNIRKLMGQELTKLQRQRQSLGDSTIVLDAAYRESASASPSPAFSQLQDLNECANKDLNDCSKHATCTNEFGGFSCQCMAGYEDKYQAQFMAEQANGNATNSQLDRNKLGRICMGCSPSYCSNRGECSISDGKKQCKCRANFMGARCDIDSEVLAVAIGGSVIGLIILVVTFWCLFVFNRRWRREQQKMDAMSATSGLTNYNYASNSANSTNSLMSPNASHAAAVAAAAAQQSARSMGRSSAAVAAANYVGQRFVGGLMGRSVAGNHPGHHHHHLQQHYALEQQAMLVGSGTSSGSSSAASQPLACNPYQGYAYDDGLLIAPISTGSSEQTSPSGNSYRGIIPETSNSNHTAALMAAGNAYTLSGHHHHHNHLTQQQQQLYHQLHHMNHPKQQQVFSQFHPMDQQQYTRTLANNAQQNGYDSRWRTLQSQQQEASKVNGTLAGYYLVR